MQFRPGQVFYEVRKPELCKHFEERAQHYRELSVLDAMNRKHHERNAHAFIWRAEHLPADASTFIIGTVEAQELELI